MSTDIISVLPPIGTRIPFPNSSDTVILRYVGSVAGHDGVYCGLELSGSLISKGKNSGIVDGIKYFDVEIEGSGLFVPLRKIISWISGSVHSNNNNNLSQNNSQPSLTPRQSIANNNILNTPHSNTRQSGIFDDSQIQELKDYIKLLQERLESRENDLKELDVQIDELDVSMRAKDARLARKEEKFENYKKEKENEVEILMNTVKTLGESIEDLKIKLNEKSKVIEENSSDKREELENELEMLRKEFNQFKVSKNKEVNELRKFEMINYQLEMKIEKLSNNGNGTNNSSEEIKMMKIEYEKIKVENDHLKDANMKLQKENDELIQHNRTILEENNNLLKEKEQYNNEIIQRDQQIEELKKRLEVRDIGKDGLLKIYVPEEKIAPSAGRSSFCEHCDMNGHATDECPYQKNEEMDLF